MDYDTTARLPEGVYLDEPLPEGVRLVSAPGYTAAVVYAEVYADDGRWYRVHGPGVKHGRDADGRIYER